MRTRVDGSTRSRLGLSILENREVEHMMISNKKIGVIFVVCLILIALIAWSLYYFKVNSDAAIWVTAVFTAVYAIAVTASLIWISMQVKEARKQAEATKVHAQETKRLAQAEVLKQAYDYIIRTYESRELLHRTRNIIETVKNMQDLGILERKRPDIKEAIYEVANCYHFIGFLIKSELLSEKSAQDVYEEGSDTILDMYKIISPIIDIKKETPDKLYKQYFRYLVEEIEKWRKQNS